MTCHSQGLLYVLEQSWFIILRGGAKVLCLHYFLPTPSSIYLKYVRIFKLTWKWILILLISQYFHFPKAQERKRLAQGDTAKTGNQASSFTLNYPNPLVPESCSFFTVSRLLLDCLNIRIFTSLLPFSLQPFNRASRFYLEKSWMRDGLKASPLSIPCRSFQGGKGQLSRSKCLLLLETSPLRFQICCPFLLFLHLRQSGAFKACPTADSSPPPPSLSLWHT